MDPQRTTTSSAGEPARTSNAARIGVALGGGSARGYAHIGALASLERHGFAPHVIVGTSFGAVVGALYATGRDVAALQAEAERTRRRDVFPYIADFGLHRAALFEGRRMEAYFDRLLEGRTFADLRRKLVVVTTDIDTGERVLIEDGPIGLALRASSSIPGVFAPVTWNGRRLVDGGIGSPVPLDTLVGMDIDVAIGIGAGMEAQDSRAIRFARRVLESDTGRKLHQAAVEHRPRSAVGRLGRALAFAADGWMGRDDWCAQGTERSVAPACEGAPGLATLEVHTRPPIHWLNFHRAGEAIRAGDAALDGLIPRLRSSLAELTSATAAARTAVRIAAPMATTGSAGAAV
ncbi:MAG: patatin-like phospholipase family protein [Trueperaceae bacterium]